MTKIIWMTDPHFQNEGLIKDLNPRTRLKAAIDHMNTHHADADCMMLTGDLVGDDIAGDYSGIATYLERSTVPVYPMVGNNDERAGFRAHLPLPDTAMVDFVQYTVQTSVGLMICLDTHMIGSAAGEFCAARIAWLRDTLHVADGPVYIFMHHPPMDLGLPPQDSIKLAGGETFLELVGAHPNVKHLFMGHVHRPTCGTIRGLPFATLGALSFQAPAPQPTWDWDSFVPPPEAPHYGVLYIENGNVTLQHTQFCDYGTGIET